MDAVQIMEKESSTMKYRECYNCFFFDPWFGCCNLRNAAPAMKCLARVKDKKEDKK